MNPAKRASALALACALTFPAFGQTAASYPDRPIRIVVPFAAGGATDVIARVVGQKLSTQLGQPVVVENKAGANGNIGAVTVARAAPDGYTILMATSSHAINATLYRKLDYSLTRDLTALSNLASVPLVLVVNPEVPARTVAEFVAYAKAQGDKLNFGSGGNGTAAHLAGEQFNTLTGTRLQHVAYKGGALAQTDLMGGQIQAMFANLPEVLSQVQAGKLVPLAVTGNSRRANLPKVPTFAEAGVAQMDLRSWFGLFAPAATPAPVVARLSAALAQSVADGAVQARLKELGADPIGDTHEAFQKFVALDVPRWGALVERSGATAD
ncbi:tripartite tricarboxylate transporter substrate binding protein [Xylophilus rhododendri]|uniref:Tripartite tricarboxylate transporter substrate binding protein n=1 Tax=Xylophilus rhododendri TaxID=2697032 RepID=A0A857J1W9_9BURK|nr:tripartite tricarboxylate transporter substrate binding protein [Xylophilus rhododendri]QHI97607.1 tripartite tricarboxylate transporter substrate binding protein [Xylophilus rhododendri]